jgi:hypothetical protein
VAPLVGDVGHCNAIVDPMKGVSKLGQLGFETLCLGF